MISSVVNAQLYEGYTLFSPTSGGGQQGGSGNSYLMDNDLNIIHTWQYSRGAASMPYLFPDSSILHPYRVANVSMNGGGVGGGIAHIAWDGTVLWDYTVSNDTYQHHHDIQPLPNGNILVIAWERKTAQEAYAKGRESGTINNSLNQMWFTAILELEPTPPDQANIVWEWHLWDHLIQDYDSSLPDYGMISDYPERMDINSGSVGNAGPQSGGDWMHVNAIDYNAELDQIVFSARHQHEIYLIDHSTTTEEAAGHTGGNSGKGGDFLYRWGNPQNYGRGTESNRQLDGQHGVNWIPRGYPGEGNLILFNNHYTTTNSAVFELITPLSVDSTNYLLDGNNSYGPENPVWLHSVGMHSNVQSGAFRLPNGNTLISVADEATLIEIDSTGIELWDYEYTIGSNPMIARAQKYPIDFLGGGDTTVTPVYSIGDINYDDKIDIIDLCYLVDMVHDEYPPNESADINENGDVYFDDYGPLILIIMRY